VHRTDWKAVEMSRFFKINLLVCWFHAILYTITTFTEEKIWKFDDFEHIATNFFQKNLHLHFSN